MRALNSLSRYPFQVSITICKTPPKESPSRGHASVDISGAQSLVSSDIFQENHHGNANE